MTTDPNPGARGSRQYQQWATAAVAALEASPTHTPFLADYRVQRGRLRIRMRHLVDEFYRCFKMKNGRIVPVVKWSVSWPDPLEPGPVLDLPVEAGEDRRRLCSFSWRMGMLVRSSCAQAMGRRPGGSGKQAVVHGDCIPREITPGIALLRAGQIVEDHEIDAYQIRHDLISRTYEEYIGLAVRFRHAIQAFSAPSQEPTQSEVEAAIEEVGGTRDAPPTARELQRKLEGRGSLVEIARLRAIALGDTAAGLLLPLPHESTSTCFALRLPVLALPTSTPSESAGGSDELFG